VEVRLVLIQKERSFIKKIGCLKRISFFIELWGEWVSNAGARGYIDIDDICKKVEAVWKMVQMKKLFNGLIWL